MRLSFLLLILLFNLFLYSQRFDKTLPKDGSIYYKCNYKGYVQSYFLDMESRTNYDLNFLTTNWSIKEIYKSAKYGKYKNYFNEATLVKLQVNNEEEYFNIKNGICYSLGTVVESNEYTSPIVIRYLPYHIAFNSNSKLGNKYSNIYTTEIILKKQGLVNKNLNSDIGEEIKIVINSRENTYTSFEGTLQISNTFRKVKRLETTVINSFTTYTKVKSSNWKPVALSLSSLPKVIAELYKDNNYTRVQFICNDFVGPIASYDIIEDEIKNLEFQENEVSPISINFSYDEGEIIAWPNPTMGPIHFEVFNHPYDEYKLEIYNLVGKKLYTKSFSKMDGRRLFADLSSLKRGTYIYSIFDGKGKKLLTKRISMTSI